MEKQKIIEQIDPYGYWNLEYQHRQLQKQKKFTITMAIYNMEKHFLDGPPNHAYTNSTQKSLLPIRKQEN